MIADPISWRNVPRQALIDALRNCGLGSANLSRQDKTTLVRDAQVALRSDRRESFLAHLETEIAFRKSEGIR